MNLLAKTLASITVAATATLGIFDVPVMAITLSNGSGPNTISVGVDAFGSFGSAIGGDGTSDALYTPADGGAAVETVGQSGVLIRGISDELTFLSSGSFYTSTGGTDEQFLSTSSDTATSSFRFGDLLFELEQTLTAQLDKDNNQTGSVLTQTYTVTNTSAQASNFELFRFLQPNLKFTQDGNDIVGGRIVVPEFGDLLFATDTISSTIDPVISIGITATGGTVPESGRYEAGSFDTVLTNGLQSSPTAQLGNLVVYDTTMGDNDGILEVSDLPEGFNIDFPLSLTLNNVFSLNQGETTTYTTRTTFGVGIPSVAPEPEPVPESTSSLGLLVFGLLGAGCILKRK
jgi:hypothetical protein